MARPVAAAYADCIGYGCPACGAASNRWCTNIITGDDMVIPHLARAKLAEGDRP